MRKSLLSLGLMFMTVSCMAQQKVEFSLVPLQVGDQQIEVQVADTIEKRMRGLMEQQPVVHGMLLLNDEPREMVLWMRNTPSDLDVAFVDSQWTIVSIQAMQANTDTLHPSNVPVIAALEMPLGWFDKHQIRIGMRVQNCKRWPASC